MKEEEINLLIQDSLKHLREGRFRIALKLSEQAIEMSPHNSDALSAYAWALLENGDPSGALDYANLAVEIDGRNLSSKIHRSYLLMRMSIYEGSMSEAETSLLRLRDMEQFTYATKGRCLAGEGRFEEALEVMQIAQSLNTGLEPGEKTGLKYFTDAVTFNNLNENDKKQLAEEFLKEAASSLIDKEYWFALHLTEELEPLVPEESLERLRLIELEANYRLFRYKPARAILQKIKEDFSDNPVLMKIKNELAKYDQESRNPGAEKGARFMAFQNEYLDVFSCKPFNAEKEGRREYFEEFVPKGIKAIGFEILAKNPLFLKRDASYECTAVWNLDDLELSRRDFTLRVQSDWESFVFAQSCTLETENLQSEVSCSILIEGETVCRGSLKLGCSGFNEPEVKELLTELGRFTGLDSVKKSVRDLIDFIKFEKQRRLAGYRSSGNIYLNAIFLGNPGTGKTTVARLLAKLLKAMGIIPEDKLIEVDRAALVGQYLGETAQKTEKVIKSAMGGVLFIDEAYSLVKKEGSSQDFGQEAIDILLKRMEDHKGKFSVIVAGYTDEMEKFLESNPGLKSRFNRTITFEDYSPDELLSIFKSRLSGEDYRLEDQASEFLHRKLTELYRVRDKTFGNARMISKIFDDVKIQLGKRFLRLSEEERTDSAMVTITKADIEASLEERKKERVSLRINEQRLEATMNELMGLTGLESVKKETERLLSSLKVSGMRKSRGLKIMDRSLHSVFTGNPGTGKTTVARIMSSIYREMGLLEKGQLVEVDRAGLVAGYQGQTAEKTDRVIHQALGGTLFIDEAYSLNRGKNDFGQEAIDTLLKRMEDYKGQFVVIVAGYTNEMLEFLESNPGLKSRFNNFFDFEDYRPRQMLEISAGMAEKNGYRLDEGALQGMLEIFSEAYSMRDKNFGNARLARNILYKSISYQEERIARLLDPDAKELMTIAYEDVQKLLPGEISPAL